MKMPILLVDNPESEIRQRHGGVTGMVQELDVFMKVSDDVKEEPKAVNGILSVVCFSLIFFLLIGHLYEYLTNEEVEYKFSVDVEYEQALTLDVDMIVATPCTNLAIMPMGVDSSIPPDPFRGLFASEEKSKKNDDGGADRLHKNPSRFEMNEEEARLWSALQKVHKERFKPGSPIKAVNERTFLQDDVEHGLLVAADEKQRLEIDELARQRKEAKAAGKGGNDSSGDDSNSGVMFMIGNGFGVFQIIAAGGTGRDSSELAEGTACRINGKVPVLKGNGDRLTIAVGKSLNIGNMLAHFGGMTGNHDGNISHRIERFHFGPHVWGLVTPLAGNEQIVDKPGIVFQYYIKVVPTKIYKNVATALFNRPDVVYQYAVTYAKRQKSDGEHMHDSIVFDYEFSDINVEVWPKSISVVQLLLRICAIVGGIFATSRFIETVVSLYYSWFTCK